VRAVFHSVKPGGHVIVATFAEDGPNQCSGLPVYRSYDTVRMNCMPSLATLSCCCTTRKKRITLHPAHYSSSFTVIAAGIAPEAGQR
jgi:hypothetical protein